MRLFVPRSEHHPLGRGGQAVTPPLGFADGHGGNLPIALQDHQLPETTRGPQSLDTTNQTQRQNLNHQGPKALKVVKPSILKVLMV